MDTFMHLAEAMRPDRERQVVGRVAAHLEQARSLVPEEQKEKYNAFIRAQFNPITRELGWEPRPDDTDEQKAMRAILLPVLGEAGDPDAVAAAQKIVQQYLGRPGSTDAAITRPAFELAGSNGNAELYDTISAALNKAKSTDEYYYCLSALTAFRRPELTRRTLELVDQGRIREQDYPSLFAALLENPTAHDQAWQYLKSHWDALANKVTSFGGRGAVSALGSSCSERDREDVKQFFTTHRAPGAERAVQQSLDAIDNCLDFKQVQQANMTKWLSQQ
jgi:aminopeptidase N